MNLSVSVLCLRPLICCIISGKTFWAGGRIKEEVTVTSFQILRLRASTAISIADQNLASFPKRVSFIPTLPCPQYLVAPLPFRIRIKSPNHRPPLNSLLCHLPNDTKIPKSPGISLSLQWKEPLLCLLLKRCLLSKTSDSAKFVVVEQEIQNSCKWVSRYKCVRTHLNVHHLIPRPTYGGYDGRITTYSSLFHCIRVCVSFWRTVPQTSAVKSPWHLA